MDGSQSQSPEPTVKSGSSTVAVVESNTFSAADVKSWVREVLDWIVKLLPIIATVLVAYVADHYKASLTASTLLSQREQADSQLRSQMFAKLVDPISGTKPGVDVPLERAQLLAELLSLNFHEHIGLKPLLSHVDARLARQRDAKSGHEADVLDRARQSFRSVAKTVISRQTAMLTRTGEGGETHDGAQVFKLDIGTAEASEKFAKELANEDGKLKMFGEPFAVENPLGTHQLFLRITSADWKNQTFHVDVSIHQKPKEARTSFWKLAEAKSEIKSDIGNREFDLSWFDFPLTDNTLLADGTRFAIVLDQIYDASKRFGISWPGQPSKDAAKRVQMNIIWFPKDYIAAHERPMNHREFRKSLGLDG